MSQTRTKSKAESQQTGGCDSGAVALLDGIGKRVATCYASIKIVTALISLLLLAVSLHCGNGSAKKRTSANTFRYQRWPGNIMIRGDLKRGDYESDAELFGRLDC